tara:strand:+ start:41 stop:175 length:135 start_codon:yes stop_codon:yes gene_type:complete
MSLALNASMNLSIVFIAWEMGPELGFAWELENELTRNREIIKLK